MFVFLSVSVCLCVCLSVSVSLRASVCVCVAEVSTNLHPLGQQLVAGQRVPLVKGDAERRGTSEGEIGARGAGGGVGVLQLSAQFQPSDACSHVSGAHLHGLSVLRDHLLLLLHLVVHDAELGAEECMPSVIRT